MYMFLVEAITKKCEVTIKLNFFRFPANIYIKKLYLKYHYITFTGQFLPFRSDKMRIKKHDNSVQTIYRVSVSKQEEYSAYQEVCRLALKRSTVKQVSLTTSKVGLQTCYPLERSFPYLYVTVRSSVNIMFPEDLT